MEEEGVEGEVGGLGSGCGLGEGGERVRSGWGVVKERKVRGEVGREGLYLGGKGLLGEGEKKGGVGELREVGKDRGNV